jgi:competence ComEA-like helix-hairpin-helix protein
MTHKPFVANWRRLTTVLIAFGLSLAFSGCEEQPLEDVSIRPGWVQSQEFHIESRYQKLAVSHDRGDTSADPAADDLGDTMDLVSDTWSDSVYWRYQVIHQGLRPAEGDDFYEYAVMGGTESPLTVIKASLDPSLNLGGEMLDADPKIYMVIREDRLRMAGLVAFVTSNGTRLSEAITVDADDMNRSFSRLSQSNLSIIPHFMPPFPIRAENADMVLEDGQEVTFTNASAAGVDVIYENAMDDTLIAETWEDGQPWASWSVTDSVESRLLDPEEVDELNGGMPTIWDGDDDPEDFDFVQLLKSPINLSASLQVDGLLGNNTHQVREGYRPWAGSWWRQSEGALVFGHLSSGETISKTQKEYFSEPATSVQNLGEELRNMRKNGQGDSEEYDAKVAEYKEAQSTFVDRLVEFYNAVRAAVDGGQIVIEDGRLKADDDWNATFDGFDVDINKLSAMDKFALIQHKNGSTHGSNPWFVGAWELLNHWSPAGSGWWGHCNGWAAAAILTHEPREAHTIQFGSTNQYEIELNVGDQKGLLSESYYSQLSSFYGARYNGDDGDDIGDLSPKAVLQILSIYIGERNVPLVFDTTAGDQVWNFPAWRYTLNLSETTVGGGGETTSGLININTAGVEELDTLWGISVVRANRIIQYREQNGPFQTIEEIVDVRGIGWGIFNRIKDQLTVSEDTRLRTFDGHVTVKFATDGVGYNYVDSDQNNPQGFEKTWHFTLEASPAGEIITSSWDNNEEHPDFAWVPYSNTVYAGRSENPYLHWTNLRNYLPEGMVRD